MKCTRCDTIITIIGCIFAIIPFICSLYLTREHKHSRPYGISLKGLGNSNEEREKAIEYIRKM